MDGTWTEINEKALSATVDEMILVVDIANAQIHLEAVEDLPQEIETGEEEMIGSKEIRTIEENDTHPPHLDLHLGILEGVIEKISTEKDLTTEKGDIHPPLQIQREAAVLIVDEVNQLIFNF